MNVFPRLTTTTALASIFAVTGLAATALLPAHAAPATQVENGQAPATRNETIEELQKRLDQRDAVIRDLLRRVEVLERRATPASETAAVSAEPRVVPAVAKASAGQPPSRPRDRRFAQQAPPAQAAPDGSAPAAPGQFKVDKEAAERALERALVQSGALLLPPGTAEIVPSLGYVRRESSRPQQLAVTTNNQVFVTQNVNRSDQVDAGLLFRAGLPWNSQVQLGVPYRYIGNSNATRVAGAGLSDQTTRAWGFGDPNITFTKALTKEGEWLPSLFASVGWDSNFGQKDNGIDLGSGFNEISGSLTATKRQDPLVFTAGLGYTTAFKDNDIRPGDQISTSVGMLFAVSPETSLRFSPQVTFVGKTKFGGRSVPGSDQVVGTFTFGMLSILGPGVVLDFSADVGLTQDAPAFAIRAGFPIRFNLGQ